MADIIGKIEGLAGLVLLGGVAYAALKFGPAIINAFKDAGKGVRDVLSPKSAVSTHADAVRDALDAERRAWEAGDALEAERQNAIAWQEAYKSAVDASSAVLGWNPFLQATTRFAGDLAVDTYAASSSAVSFLKGQSGQAADINFDANQAKKLAERQAALDAARADQAKKKPYAKPPKKKPYAKPPRIAERQAAPVTYAGQMTGVIVYGPAGSTAKKAESAGMPTAGVSEEVGAFIQSGSEYAGSKPVGTTGSGGTVYESAGMPTAGVSEEVGAFIQSGSEYAGSKPVGTTGSGGIVYESATGARQVVSSGQIVAGASRALDPYDVARLPKSQRTALGYSGGKAYTPGGQVYSGGKVYSKKAAKAAGLI